MARKKATVYIEEGLLKAAKVMAAQAGVKEYQVFEEALRRYFEQGVVEKVWRRSTMGGKQALRLAYRELRAARR